MTPQPDRYAVLGHPVAHSRSPFILARFAAATGEAVVYDRVLCPLDGFAGCVRAFAREGGRGCNVTVPFKFEALALAAHASERARLAGAANVLRLGGSDERDWFADNTDGIGLVRDIEQHAGVALAGTGVLLVGAGGAGAGVLGPLLQARPARLRVLNRTADKARALAARHAAPAAAQGVVLEAGGLDAPGTGWNVVINASSSSLHGAPPPVPGTVFAPGALAVDLMYGEPALPFLEFARAHGAHARDGLGMLVEQAAEAFFVWRGARPATAPVLAALREAVAAGQPA
jgi:shikimate dehydrogenase